MKRKDKNIITTPNGEDKVLLHSCCAPCSLAIIETLLANNIRPTVFYYNPNIYPLDEYLKRKDEAIKFVSEQGLDFIDADYDYGGWKCQIKGLENEPERGGRCFKCFCIRMNETAKYAYEHGFSLFTTTLASSRWKNLEQINKAGIAAAEKYNGVTYWEHNWRKNGLQERRNELLRTYNFYNQQYCGCEFSIRKEDINIESKSE